MSLLSLTLPVSEKLKLVDRLEIISVDDEIWLRNLELAWNHKDPADRTIVALASIRDCALITSDKTIRRFFKQTVLVIYACGNQSDIVSIHDNFIKRT